jgi:hypothetical protein
MYSRYSARHLPSFFLSAMISCKVCGVSSRPLHSVSFGRIIAELTNCSLSRLYLRAAYHGSLPALLHLQGIGIGLPTSTLARESNELWPGESSIRQKSCRSIGFLICCAFRECCLFHALLQDEFKILWIEESERHPEPPTPCIRGTDEAAQH